MPRPKDFVAKRRRKKFVKELLKTGNATEAVARTYPNQKRTTAGTYADQLMKRDDIQQEIKEAMITNELDPDNLLKHTNKIVAKGKDQLDNQRVSPELYAKTLNDLMRIYMKLGSKNKQTTNLNINIDASTTPELLKKREEYSSFFNDIIDGEQVTSTSDQNNKSTSEGTATHPK